jgi:hypothetical protein
MIGFMQMMGAEIWPSPKTGGTPRLTTQLAGSAFTNCAGLKKCSIMIDWKNWETAYNTWDAATETAFTAAVTAAHNNQANLLVRIRGGGYAPLGSHAAPGWMALGTGVVDAFAQTGIHLTNGQGVPYADVLAKDGNVYRQPDCQDPAYVSHRRRLAIHFAGLCNGPCPVDPNHVVGVHIGVVPVLSAMEYGTEMSFDYPANPSGNYINSSALTPNMGCLATANTTGTFVVATTTGWPTSGIVLVKCQNELVLCTAGAAGLMTVNAGGRGFSGSVSTGHGVNNVAMADTTSGNFWGTSAAPVTAAVQPGHGVTGDGAIQTGIFDPFIWHQAQTRALFGVATDALTRTYMGQSWHDGVVDHMTYMPAYVLAGLAIGGILSDNNATSLALLDVGETGISVHAYRNKVCVMRTNFSGSTPTNWWTTTPSEVNAMNYARDNGFLYAMQSSGAWPGNGGAAFTQQVAQDLIDWQHHFPRAMFFESTPGAYLDNGAGTAITAISSCTNPGATAGPPAEVTDVGTLPLQGTVPAATYNQNQFLINVIQKAALRRFRC